MALLSWGLANKKYGDPSECDASTLLAPACDLAELPTDGTPFSPCRAFQADAVGTATVTTLKGSVITGYVLTGVEQNVCITAIDDLTGATAVWGLY